MPFHLVPARDRKLHRLVKKATSVRMAKGRSLYVAGDPAKDVFLVLDGFVRLVLPGMEKGRGERIVSLAVPWEVFGDEAFTEGHRRYGAVAGSKCTVLPLPEGRLLAGLKTPQKASVLTSRASSENCIASATRRVVRTARRRLSGSRRFC